MCTFILQPAEDRHTIHRKYRLISHADFYLSINIREKERV
jgi:hypothetical protein